MKGLYKYQCHWTKWSCAITNKTVGAVLKTVRETHIALTNRLMHIGASSNYLESFLRFYQNFVRPFKWAYALEIR